MAPGPSGYSLLFTDSLTGYLGSTSVWKTTNGGDTWYQTNSPNTYGGISKIFFINNQTGWYVTLGGAIFKTIDNGGNWFQQLYSNVASFTSVFFKDSLSGWSLLPIYSTTNGGENWIQRTDIQIYDANDIYFIGSKGFIINFLELDKTTDSGNTWFTQFISQYVIRTFGWLTDSHGFIIGDGIFETLDSGESWNEILELRNIGLRKLQSPLPYIGYSIGKSGLIYKYLDTTYTPVELTSFSGSLMNNKEVELRWTTASEKNNYGFEIEKTNNQTNWKIIGFVKGNGTTTEKHIYTYVDKLGQNKINCYRLKQMDYNGEYSYSSVLEINLSLPFSINLYQNYPNPFNPTTSIDYTIPEEMYVSIILYDINGRELEELVKGKKQAGYYTVELNSKNLSSGVYFYRMITNKGYQSIKKLIIIK